jgi:hypothetical protein
MDIVLLTDETDNIENKTSTGNKCWSPSPFFLGLIMSPQEL